MKQIEREKYMYVCMYVHACVCVCEVDSVLEETNKLGFHSYRCLPRDII